MILISNGKIIIICDIIAKNKKEVKLMVELDEAKYSMKELTRRLKEMGESL